MFPAHKAVAAIAEYVGTCSPGPGLRVCLADIKTQLAVKLKVHCTAGTDTPYRASASGIGCHFGQGAALEVKRQ